MKIAVSSSLPEGVTAKDLALAIIGAIGTGGAAGHVIEYCGDAIRSLSMEARMTLCNMSIEAGARAALIAPDETTFAYIQGRRFAPIGDAWNEAVSYWSSVKSDEGAIFDSEYQFAANNLVPHVTWGTTPGMVAPVTGHVPDPATASNTGTAEAMQRALAYMDLRPGTAIEEIKIDRVFIGSCTNSRLEDLRLAANVVRGYHVNSNVRAMIVPGSQAVKRAAEAEGLDQLFRQAGFEWRESGCSMCLGMNPDVLAPGERCAATSNRNFEGRQGRGGRTHLVSPSMAAAAAVAGHFVDVRQWEFRD